ncbi:MAG: O-phosphoserine--tRNA ligase [Candidatus Hydrothermarchaeaceae archaeon]
MPRWNSKEIADAAKDDFEGAWQETKGLVGTGGAKKAKGGGSSNQVHDIIQRLREAYIDMGFEEMINPILIEDTEVRRQFGPEAAAVLDRCYYLGGLPRPDIGLSDDKLQRLNELGISALKEEVQGVLRRYKTGEMGGDDFIYELAGVLRVDDARAARVLDEVFPEFKKLEPVSSRTTLRSHMTSGWFLTLQSLAGKKSLPVRLFSIDTCFRREQREDASHLRAYHSASCVVMDEEAGVEDGEEVARGLLSEFGFEDFKFKPDEKRSKYYAPDTQTEVYAFSKKTRWVEVATFGVYSPVALSRYGVEVPVMNLGLGVERLAMVLHGIADVRELAYPQFYGEFELTDAEIAGMIGFIEEPLTKEGAEIADKIVEVGLKNSKAMGPVEFLAYEGKLLGKNVEVKLVEVEEQRLLGPAALNELYVHDGNVYGVSKEKATQELLDEGSSAGIRYLDAVARMAARRMEMAVEEGDAKVTVRVKMAKLPSDINIAIADPAMRYITGRTKSIDLRGPVFVAITAEIK